MREDVIWAPAVLVLGNIIDGRVEDWREEAVCRVAWKAVKGVEFPAMREDPFSSLVFLSLGNALAIRTVSVLSVRRVKEGPKDSRAVCVTAYCVKGVDSPGSLGDDSIDDDL